MRNHRRNQRKLESENMHLVTLECRNCESAVSFASDFMADENPTHSEMQHHMDLNFLANCGGCFSRSWEVYSIKPAVNPHRTQELFA